MFTVEGRGGCWGAGGLFYSSPYSLPLVGCTAHVQMGQSASVERCWHVGFTPDSGRIAATQRTDASGQ